MSYPFLIQGNNLVVVIGNKSHTISKTHITYQKVVDAIKAGDWDSVKDFIEPKKVVLKYGKGNVTIEGDKLFWKGAEFHNSVAVRTINMLQEGFPVEPMINFMENLMQNPSMQSVKELYGFLEKNNLPVTPDGHFLAFKKVRSNFLDVHSGTMDNSPGKIVEMERNEVDDNRDRTCSAGLHFCSQSYLSHFGGEKIVIVKINPKDVVSIPSDYNDAKGRACRYEVIGELGVDPDEAFDKTVQENANGTTTVRAPAWPLPADVNSQITDSVTQDDDETEQEFDKYGRPLSMSKDAIRKREIRAQQRAAKVPQATSGATHGPAKAPAVKAAQAAAIAKNAAWPLPVNKKI